MKNNLKIKVLVTLLVTASGAISCAPQGVAPPPQVTISVEDQRLSPGMDFGLLLANPIQTSDFNCFAVNVTGYAVSVGNSLSTSACTSSSNMQGKGFGTLSKAFTRGTTVDIDVPTGTSLNFDIYGLYPSPAEGCSGLSTGIAGYFLGGVTQVIKSVTGLTIPISYSNAASDLSCGTATLHYLYVVNQTSGSISAFQVNPTTGALIGAGTTAVTGPYALTASPNGSFLYVLGGSGVYGYTVNKDTGALTLVAGSPFAASISPQGLTVSPNNQFLYVANTGSGGVISGYTINQTTGVLSAMAGSPFASGSGTNSVVVEPSGNYLYSSNDGVNTIARFAITPVTGIPTGITTIGANQPSYLAIGSNSILLSANAATPSMGAFSINAGTGALTGLTGSPFTVAGTNFYLAVDPTGKYAYSSNVTTNNLSGFMFNSTTGTYALTSPATFSTGASPKAPCIDSRGKYLYVSNGTNLLGFNITEGTGSLTTMTGSPFTAGTGPAGCVVIAVQ